MRSLTLRIFFAFWLIIALLTGLAGIAGYSYAERMREALENFEMSETVLAASDALASGGREGLARWLKSLPVSMPVRVYVVDRAGNDLLGRELSERTSRMLRRFDRGHRSWLEDREPHNLRQARPFTRLRGPDGSIYTLVIGPKRHPVQEWMNLRAGPAFALLAVLLSAAVSWFLARAITRPVRAFREATVAIAEGRLDTRVAERVRNRRDDIGLLAHDLDAMASKLEQSVERQRELTRNISHELRSPLARLRVALELARRRAGELEEFRRIDEESERIDELVGQLLRYARIDTTEADDRELVRLAELLEQVVDDANFECRSAGLDGVGVRLRTEADPSVDANAFALASAFENVLRNAIHHSPPGAEVVVTIRSDGSRAVVDVDDLGPGVEAGEEENLFEPFYRGSEAMESGRAGAGLGLAIAARAVRLHMGTIRASNLEGGGLRIRITLPVRIDADA